MKLVCLGDSGNGSNGFPTRFIVHTRRIAQTRALKERAANKITSFWRHNQWRSLPRVLKRYEDQGMIRQIREVPFEELVYILRRKPVISVTRRLIMKLHRNCENVFRRQREPDEEDDVNIRVFLTVHMIVLHPGNVFEDSDEVVCNLSDAAVKLFGCFNGIIEQYKANKTFHTIDSNLARSFVPLLVDFFRKFKLWKVSDEAKLTLHINCALIALYNAQQQLPTDEPEDSPLSVELRVQIERLSCKLQQIAGQEKLLQWMGLDAWMGLDNLHMSFEMLKGRPDGTGEATISVPILQGDPNTLKLGISIRDPKTNMQQHLASSFVELSKLADGIEGVSCCDAAKFSLSIKDNYSQNKVLLHFSNAGTDLLQLRSAIGQLRPSAMLKSAELNQKVGEMTNGIHNMIESLCKVSNANGGPNFANSMCFTQSMGCTINYPLLNMTYDSARHRTPLPVLSYMALATLHSVGLSAADAMALPDHEYMQKFFVPMCTSFTACSAQRPWSTRATRRWTPRGIWTNQQRTSGWSSATTTTSESVTATAAGTTACRRCPTTSSTTTSRPSLPASATTPRATSTSWTTARRSPG